MPNLYYFQLEKIIAELKETLPGSFIRRIQQPDPLIIVITLRANQENVRFQVSLQPGFTRCHLSQKKLLNPPTAPGFCMLLRKYLENARLCEIKLKEEDRIVVLTCSRLQEEKIREYDLLLELWGASGNIHLLDESKRILGSARRLGSSNPVGSIYEEKKKVVSSFSSNSKQPDDFLTAHHHPESPYPWNFAADIFFTDFAEQEQKKRLYEKICSQLKKEQKRILIRLRRLDESLREAQKKDAFRKWGELLKSQLHLIEKGDSEVLLVDYYDSESKKVIVSLNPQFSPQENMEFFFKRYRKLSKGIDIVQQEKKQTQEKYDKCTQNLSQIKEWGWEETPLDKLQKMMRLSPSSSSSQKKLAEGKSSDYRSFTSRDNWEILVGKGARENDTLTFQVSRGNDFWLHSEDYGGSHVIVRSQGKKSLPEQTLLDAAHLAAHYSKARNHHKVSIIYTKRKNITKPKKARPGNVLISQKKNIFIEVDEKRLNRLLGKTIVTP